jgi:hypothetical protein
MRGILTTQNELDERDQAIIARRTEALNAITGPREGDFVDFADGTRRRIAYIWHDEHRQVLSVQTCRGGSFYLGNGGVSMSGSLYDGVKPETLTLTAETAPGSVWIFHHDWHTAHNGVDTEIQFRVYSCTELPTT